MTRIDELGRQTRHHGNRPFVAYRLEQRHRAFGVLNGKQRQSRPVAGIALPIGALRILFLQLRRVCQDDARQIRGRRRAEDASAKALPDQPREVPRMVEMGVREDDGMNVGRAHRQWLPVTLPQFLQSLKQPAVDQDALASDVEQMFGTGYGARGAEARQCHSDQPSLYSPWRSMEIHRDHYLTSMELYGTPW